MTILLFNGSPRKQGNTACLLQQIKEGAAQAGARAELVHLRDFAIAPCRGCLRCEATGQCVVPDGMQLLYPRIAAADGIVLGSPVYTYNVTAYMKAFLDRLYCWYSFSEDRHSWTSRLAPGKRAAAVAVGEQEKPEHLGFALEAMALPLKDLGFSLKGTLLAAGFLRAGSVKEDQGLMEKALALGIELARE